MLGKVNPKPKEIWQLPGHTIHTEKKYIDKEI
jgi:hypothetical protein